jgi:hypothetical protein
LNWLSAKNGFTKLAVSGKLGLSAGRMVCSAKAGLTQILKVEISVISGPIDGIVW